MTKVVTKQRRHGWRADIPDHRDLKYKKANRLTVPASVDMQNLCPPVYDQGDLGSCTANTLAGLDQFDRMKEGISNWVPSRLFIYYNERELDGTVSSDSGSELRDGIKAMAVQGVCDETEWPYIENQFSVKPPDTCYTDANSHRILKYQRIKGGNISLMKACLAEGYPFVFGVSVFDSFESDEVAASGIVPMPSPDEASAGGHAIMAVGYDDKKQMFKIRNSWGADWGLQGYCWFPYEYLANHELASDFWTIRTVQ